MDKITLIEYAARCGKDAGNARKMAAAGRFKTAVKSGRDWFIDPAEPWPADARIKTGKYIKGAKSK